MFTETLKQQQEKRREDNEEEEEEEEKYDEQAFMYKERERCQSDQCECSNDLHQFYVKLKRQQLLPPLRQFLVDDV